DGGDPVVADGYIVDETSRLIRAEVDAIAPQAGRADVMHVVAVDRVIVGVLAEDSRCQATCSRCYQVSDLEVRDRYVVDPVDELDADIAGAFAVDDGHL